MIEVIESQTWFSNIVSASEMMSAMMALKKYDDKFSGLV
jgi:hypothetical protein